MNLDAGNFEIWRGLGQAFLAQGDAHAAVERLAVAAELAPDDLLSWTVWGEALSAAGHHHEAFRKYHVAVDLDPLNTKPRIAWRRALTRYLEGGPDQCARAGRPVADYLRHAGSGVPEAFRERLLALRARCGLSVPKGVEDS